MKGILAFFLTTFLSLAAFGQGNLEAEQAQRFYQQGEYQKALPIYEKLFSHSGNQSFYEQYFDVMLRLKEYDQADKLLKRLLKTSPENVVYRVDYGRILQEKGQQDKAKDWYNDIVKKLPKDEFEIRNVSTAFYRAGAYDYSVKALIAGRDVLKNPNAFSFDLIALYRFQKNKDALIHEYLNVIDANPDVIHQAQNGLAGVLEKDEDYEVVKKIIASRLKKNPNNVSYSRLLSWVNVQQKDFNQAIRQAIALDKRLKEEGHEVYHLSITLISNQAYPAGEEGLNYLISKGKDTEYYIPARIQLLSIKHQMLTAGTLKQNDLVQLENDYTILLKELGKNPNTVFAIRQLAGLKAYYLKKTIEAVELLEELIKMPRVPTTIVGQTKLELADLYVLTGEVWEANLVYGQVEKQFPNDPLGQEAKFRNAKLSYYMGDFEWAKAQLDVLKSSTSQLIANDALNLHLLLAENTTPPADTNALKSFTRADLLVFKKQYVNALEVLDSLNKTNNGSFLADDILMLKAQIFLKQLQFTKAITELEQISENYSYELWADDAAYLLADLYETKIKSTEKASKYYQKIITEFPNSLYVSDARKKFRALRGDVLN